MVSWKSRMFGCPEPASSCTGMRVAGQCRACYQLTRCGTTLGRQKRNLKSSALSQNHWRCCWFICTNPSAHHFPYSIRQYLHVYHCIYIFYTHSTCSYIPMKSVAVCTPWEWSVYSPRIGYASLILAVFRLHMLVTEPRYFIRQTILWGFQNILDRIQTGIAQQYWETTQHG